MGRYKIKTISELCGFSPTLLRAWESRHHLLQPARQPSGHRLYTDNDLTVLRRVSQLLAQGQSIGEIAAVGRDRLLASGMEGSQQPGAEPAAGSTDFLKNEVLQGAIGLDEARIRRALDRLEIMLTRRELVHSAVSLLSREIGALWVSGKASVASEHLLSGLLRERVHRWTVQDAAVGKDRENTVLCAGFPDEQHELGLLVLVYELRAAGRDVLCLGAGMPFLDLELAVARVRPRTVCLSVTRQVVFEVHRPNFYELVARHPEVSFFLGGLGTLNLEAEMVGLGVTVWPSHRPLSDLLEALS